MTSNVLVKIPLSVCIIVRNEQEKLPSCLRSVQWADEVIVVDDFSEDETPSICRSNPIIKYHTRHFDGYGFQKHFAVGLASNDWILSVDADEEVTPELRDEIMRCIENPEGNVGFRIRLRNINFGKVHIDKCAGGLRLFRKSRGNFTRNYVHEKVHVDGPIGQMASLLNHKSRSFSSFRDHFRINAVKYGKLGALDYHTQGRRITVWNAGWRIVLLPLAVFFYKYFWQRKFQEGLNGLYFSFSSAACYHIAYATLLKIQFKNSAASARTVTK